MQGAAVHSGPVPRKAVAPGRDQNRRVSNERDPDEELPALCDLCGAAVVNGSQVQHWWRTPPPPHPQHLELEGRRPLTACTTKHLAEPQGQSPGDL